VVVQTAFTWLCLAAAAYGLVVGIVFLAFPEPIVGWQARRSPGRRQNAVPATYRRLGVLCLVSVVVLLVLAWMIHTVPN
jgi:hypothetical protein